VSRLRRRASARKRESREAMRHVQNPVPRIGLRETPVQRGVRQAVRRVSKGASRFLSCMTRAARGARPDPIVANGFRARAWDASPPTPNVEHVENHDNATLTHVFFRVILFLLGRVPFRDSERSAPRSASASGAIRSATRARSAWRASASAWRRAAIARTRTPEAPARVVRATASGFAARARATPG
jgi:hypothetical protein